MFDIAPTPDNDNNLQYGDNISNNTFTDTETKAEVSHITFDMLKKQKKEDQLPEDVGEQHQEIHSVEQKAIYTPVHFSGCYKMNPYVRLQIIKEKAEHFLPCNSPFFLWTGVESNLQPP